MSNPAMASEDMKSNRRGPVVTPALVARVRALRREGKGLNEIADLVHWPWHCSLRRIRHWADG
jgi:hypothetical protein